uniref:Uncharacterized protein n=1 Tax=Caenorhabditis japonica TaxID=281687 RepID=A0A8R1IK79_CAEJA
MTTHLDWRTTTTSDCQRGLLKTNHSNTVFLIHQQLWRFESNHHRTNVQPSILPIFWMLQNSPANKLPNSPMYSTQQKIIRSSPDVFSLIREQVLNNSLSTGITKNYYNNIIPK